MPPTKHNHPTRGILHLGDGCPGCDEYHIHSALQARLIKLQACCLDDDNDFKRVMASVTEATIQLIDLDRRSRS